VNPSVSPFQKTILCIDDDAVILCYEKALLERSGYIVLTAPSALEGVKLATTCECDAVILDYEMPGTNGHEVAAEIKLVKPKLMVILLSRREIPVQALSLVDAFVPKLETRQQLLPLIAELCSRNGESGYRQKAFNAK
jgi:CheY-like chemotaxis protein